MTASDLSAGARNCVVDCAQVGEGSNLVIVNELSTVDDSVVAELVQAAQNVGAHVDVVWADPMKRDEAIPADVFTAFRDADILINHYHCLSREVLQQHFPDEPRVRVPNRAITPSLLASPWARFPYGLQRAISDAVEASMLPGRYWRVTSPAGTDVHGYFADANSAVASAFFRSDENDNRARRNFPGGVHPPHISNGLEGVIVAEYIDDAPFGPETPLRLEVRNGQVTSIAGGDSSGTARKRIADSDGYFDSWHAGVNPKTVVPIERAANPRKWFSFTHCSPQIIHFHLGCTYDTINVASFNHTLEIDGVVLFKDGVLNITDDDGIASALGSHVLESVSLVSDTLVV